MPLPPLYKYLDVDGATKTLGGQCFKHAKPSTFNDKEDLTVAGMFPGNLADALKNIQANLGEMILTNIDRPATCSSASMRQTVTKLQDIFRANSKAASIFVQELKKKPELLKLDVSNVEQLAQSTIDGVNEMMRRHRVFCVTTERDAEEMWSGYAEDHKGIAMRVLAGPGRDSKFELFRPVSYREKRPTIYRDGGHFMSATLFEDQDASARAAMHDIIYTKALDWQNEKEYRLVIPLDEGEDDWSLLKFHPEEITELYLGLAMDEAIKSEVVEKAVAINPAIVVFQMKRDAAGLLVPEADS